MRIRSASLCALAAAALFALPAAAGTSTTDAATVSGLDQQYIQTDASGNAFEVIGGKLALEHSSNPTIRALGARLIRDHSKSQRELLAIVRGLHQSVDPSPNPTMQWELNQLGKEWGAAFDRDYAALEYGDHVIDVQDTSHEIAYGHNPQVKDYARGDLPVLKQHRALSWRAKAALGA